MAGAVVAVSRAPDTGWKQLDVDTLLQTNWPGVYSDDTIYHVATPAFYEFGGRWFLYTQACPLPNNRHYIDGQRVASPETFTNTSPIDGTFLGEIASGGEAEANAARVLSMSSVKKVPVSSCSAMKRICSGVTLFICP